jgi:hypothetical protein
MKKNIFYAMALMLLFSSVAHANNASYQSALQNYNQALAEFRTYVKDIALKIWTSYGYRTTTTHYEYWCPSDASLNSLERYQAANARLGNEIISAALGDGFILGIAAAASTKMFGIESTDERVLLAGIVAAIGLIVCQNSNAGAVPYYDTYLDRYDNMFAQASFFTIGRIMTVLAGAAAGYFGAHYACDKFADKYNDLCHVALAQ